MLNFNDTQSQSILVGYIKELLYSFNLPSVKVFESKADCEAYFDFDIEVYVIIKNYKKNDNDKKEKGQDSVLLYIRETNQYGETSSNFFFIDYYQTNKQITNLTRNLALKNNKYDTYTHTYLGNLLRFTRDYYDINLMSLYNCYANEVHQLNSGSYKYFCIPVKYGKTYTLAFNSSKSFEYLISTDNIDDIMTSKEYTWTSHREGSYQAPFLIEVPKAISATEFFKENDLTLIIKLPVVNSSSIVCLEGDYTSHPNYYVPYQLNYEKNGERYIFEKQYSEWAKKDSFVSNIQLLKYSRTDGSSYAFSDRLVEYLIDNVITPNDDIKENIVDAKYKLYTKYMGKKKSQLGKLNSKFGTMLRFQFYKTKEKNTLCGINDEGLLGYVDKDIETLLNDERYSIGEEDD